MRETIRLRFAKEIWSVTFQSLLIGPRSPSPYLLAKMIAQECRLLFDNLASVRSVSCSKMGQLGVFQLYIKFDFPRDPHVARKVLCRICFENNALHYDIGDPLNYEEPVKLPYEQDEAGLDIYSAGIRENTLKIINDVATGMDLWVEDLLLFTSMETGSCKLRQSYTVQDSARKLA